jgi:hypothetical protein
LNLIVGVHGVKSADTKPVVILFDEGHGQFFNRSLYSQALDDIKEMGMEVIFNHNEFNRSTFEGIDVFISTNPSSSFDFEERIHITEFLETGKGMFLLANPLIEENSSLNGQGYIHNYILEDVEGVLARFWTGSRDEMTHELDDVVKNDRENLGKAEYIELEVNNTDFPIFTEYENISSVITYSCTIENARDDLIVGSTETYAETPLKKAHEFATEVVIFVKGGRFGDIDARIILSGSSIMFSDLKDPLLGENTSWYESADNSILWKNTILYLAEASSEGLTPPPDSSNYPLFLGVATLIASTMLIGGVVFYSVGSGQKAPTVIKEEYIKLKPPKKEKDVSEDQISVKKKPQPKLSKRERRMKQLQKKTKKG